MDDDEYPNFGNAYPAAVTPRTESASWNPAFREDKSVDQPSNGVTASIQSAPSDDDDFFDRYPSATPQKSLQVESQNIDAAEEEEDLYTASPTRDRKQSISVGHTVDVHYDAATPTTMDNVPHSHADAEGPISRSGSQQLEVEKTDDAPIFSPEHSAHEQEQELEEALPDHKAIGARGSEAGPDTQASQPDQGAHEPAEHYEHQGEVTALELAQDESSAAPLMEDEEPPPTPGLASRSQTMRFDGESAVQTPAKSQPSIQRAFTTNFTQQEEVQPPTNPVVEDAWPAAGDDATFGELLDQQEQTENTYERPAAPMVQSRERSGTDFFDEVADAAISRAQVEGTDASEALQNIAAVEAVQEQASEAKGESPQEHDMAAAWAAALDDDDVLVDEDSLLDEDDDLEDDLEDDDDGSAEEDGDMNARALFGEDGDDFLDDDILPREPLHVQSKQTRSNRYQPQMQQTQQAQQRPQPYRAPSVQSPLGRSAGTPDTGLFDLLNQPGSFSQAQRQPQQPQRPGIQSAQSFVDKSKGGYQSPYDLPMEIKPRRPRPQASNTSTSTQGPVAPPRSSSYSSTAAQPPSAPPSSAAQRAPSISSSVGRPPSSQGSVPAPSGANGAPASARGTPKSDNGFFADLPMTSKPRARAAYTPQPQAGMPTPPLGQQMPPQRALSGSMAPPTQIPHLPIGQTHVSQQHARQTSSAIMGGFTQPDKQPIFPEQQPQIQQQPPANAAQSASTRYSPGAQRRESHGQVISPPAQPVQNRFSPAPSVQSAPRAVSRSRYSPAPAPQSGAPNKYTSLPSQSPPNSTSNTLPMRPTQTFAPRTSSPLAYPIEQPPPELPINKDLPALPPHSNGGVTNMSMSPEHADPGKSRYAPPEPSHAQAGREASFGPPMRARTQSPGSTMKQPKLSMNQMERPASTADSPFTSMYQAQQRSAGLAKGPVLPHRRRFSRELPFAPPQNETGQDPLQRWKGHPIFKFDAGGKVLHSFPKQTPFYASGQMAPSVKCTPGDMTVQEAVTFIPMDEGDAKFPGPLPARSKGKKKEVVAWLGAKLESLERQTEQAMLNFDIPPEDKKRVEEKLVLWKLMRVFVENDGSIEGNPKIEEEARRILLPNLAQMNQMADLQSPVSATPQSDVVDKTVLMQLRQALFEGQRERAVWLAEEKKLWGHAMLIASTMGPEVWKQIVQSFVRSNVKSVGSDARSMAALYQIFAGNSEDCVDELVPPSARAGFQMISKSQGVASGNPLEGLDQWRETLALVASNRTAQDGQSVIALGKLLSSYDRVEAAHSCFLFGRSFVKHSGADDAEAHFVLLGGNHQSQAETLGNDLDTIMLTEIYEYACSLSAPSNAVPYAPHLQAYKLVHAQQLAAHGLKNKAQTYCHHIVTAMSATTRGSPYYHPGLGQAVADLDNFLSQNPESGKGMFSKPSMNKVSSGVGSWFNKFVAGDDAETSSNASGPAGVSDIGAEAVGGPFGGVHPNGASISRPQSGMDMYANVGGGMSVPGATAAPQMPSFAPSSAPGRYAPGGMGAVIASKLSPDQSPALRYAPGGQFAPRGQPSMDSMQSYQSEMPSSLGIPSDAIRPSSSRSMSAKYAPAPTGQSVLGVPRPDVHRASSDYSPVGSRRGSEQSGLSNMSYEPRPILAEQQGTPYGSYQPSGLGLTGTTASEPHEEDPAAAAHVGHDLAAPREPQIDEEGGGGYQPPSGGYEPPSGGYEPPSYQPYEPEPDSPEEADAAPKPKKKMLDDDEDDELAKRAAAVKKSAADREADDAFRKAAEADAARDKAKDGGQKKGWLGGWFAGKKDQNLAPGPIKAKLGEQSSFYYDEQQKKWINKKGGTEVTASAPTPPPPRGPPSRLASAGPPSGPPSRVASVSGLAALGAGGSRPPTSSGLSQVAQVSSGPPSRTGTPASNLSSGMPETAVPPMGSALPAGLVNGAGTPLSAPTSVGPTSAMASGPPSRPATSLSNASSIDDLLGPPGGRKAGGAKGKKKGGRYVDVMAK